jgi:ABC-type sugar transport system ATPase subunit
MTVAENIMMGHYPLSRPGFVRVRAMRREAKEVLEQLALPLRPDDITGELSLIYQRLVMVARAFSFNARLMIFDEPTATISPREVEFLLESISELSKRKVSILYVSHRLDEVDALCQGVTVLRDGRVVASLVRSEISHAALVEHLSAESAAEKTEQGATVVRNGEEPVLELQAVSGERLEDVSLTVQAGEVVGLAGMAGSGAKEVLLTICGALPFTRGSIRLCGERVRSGRTPAAFSAGIGFLPGDRSLAAFPSNPVRFNVTLPTVRHHSRGFFVSIRSERTALAALLDRVALRRDPEMLISSLSGGNQQKAIVARWLKAAPKLLLLDDPTAGVDVSTRPEIHARIREATAEGTSVLLVSTDIDELVELADRIVVFSRGEIRGQLKGREVTAARVLAAMTGQGLAEPVPAA